MHQQVRRHREIAEQASDSDARMARGDHVANPHTGMLPKFSGARNNCQYFK
jgi:hypothetical protein